MEPIEYIFILGLVTTSAFAFGGGVMLAEVIVRIIRRMYRGGKDQ